MKTLAEQLEAPDLYIIDSIMLLYLYINRLWSKIITGAN